MWNSDNCQSMLAAYPFIASLLARIAVLPASSAEVKQVLSNVKPIKTPLRDRLCTRMRVQKWPFQTCGMGGGRLPEGHTETNL